MKIDSQLQTSSLGQPDPTTPVKKPGVESGSSPVSNASGFQPGTAGSDATDGATLGASAVSLASLALQQPDVRADRVGQLRSQISAGTYQVSPSQVAAAMISDPLTGLGRGNSD